MGKMQIVDMRMFEVVKWGSWCGKDLHFTDAHIVCRIRTSARKWLSLTELLWLFASVRTVRAKMFQARISNCANLFWSEPNRNRHRTFVYITWLLSNLQKLKCRIHTLTVRRLYIWHISLKLELTVTSISCFQYSPFVYFTCSMVHMVRFRNKKCSEAGPKQRCSSPEQYQYKYI